MPSNVTRQRRGEVWWMDPNPVRGHEQGGRRPAVVVSDDEWNLGRAGLVVTCPLTRTSRPNPLHVPIEPHEATLHYRSFVLVEQARSISVERLGARIGVVSPQTLLAIERRLRALLAL